MDKETDKDISKLRDLIDAGRKLQEKSPKISDSINMNDEELIKNELECHKWYTKVKSNLTEIFGENSKQLRSFVSHFTQEYTYANLLGTSQTIRRYFYDNIGKGIAELEVFVENFDTQEKVRNQSSVNDVFDMLNLHPKVREVSESLFKDGHYSDAILKSLIALEDCVKQKSGVSDRDGFDLMNHVFSEDRPILKLNEFKTRTDKEEQKGFRFIFAGVMAGIRNPKAHTIVIQKDPLKTLEYLSLASLLFKRLDECKK